MEEQILINDKNFHTSELQRTQPYSFYVYNILSLAWPAAITAIMWPLHQVIGIYFVGLLSNVKYIDAVSLATSWVGVFAVSIQYGFTSSQDTLITQSFGKQEYKACGVFLNRGIVLLTFVTITCSIFIWFSVSVFHLFGIEPEICEMAIACARWQIPCLILNVPWLLLENFMLEQKIVHPPMVMMIINTALYPCFCYFCIFMLNMSYLGMICAKFISLAVYISMILSYMRISGCCDKTLIKLDKSAFEGWNEYCKLAVPSTLMGCLEWWIWEILNLISGTLGIAELAVTTILIQISSLLYIVNAGIGGASGILVGNSIGEGNLHNAKAYTFSGIIMTVLTITFFSLVVLINRINLTLVFTSEQSVLGIMNLIVFIFALHQISDMTQGVMGRIIIATGSQYAGSIANLVCNYGILLPSSLLLAFFFKMGVYGLWLGFLIGSLSILVWYGRLIYNMDWEQILKDSEQRIQSGKLDQ